MQFTQIHEISTFLNSNLQDQISFNEYFTNNTWFKTLSQQDILSETQFSKVIINLDELSIEKPNNPSQNCQQLLKSSQAINNSQYKMTNESNQYDQNLQSEQIYQKKYDKTKSIMFKTSYSIVNPQIDSKYDSNFIKVFYFNSPVMKLIPYNKKSTIKDLIQKSLDVYIFENSDTLKIHQPIQNFQMRLPTNQNDFSPDMNIQAIHPERLLSQNLFQTLILLEKSKKQDNYHSRPTKQFSSFDQSSMSLTNSVRSESMFGSSELIKITIMDQTYFELMQIELQKDGNLERLFKIVKDNGLNNYKQFVIKDDLQSQFELSSDYQVKLIQKNRLYLMDKKYMDEGDDQIILKPIRLKSLIPQQISYLPPIGINQASKYEQFQVTKISSIGIALDRIIGIDQQKIYNYEKVLKQKKKDVSFVDKFLGFNDQTGTKKPFRLIKDIKQLKTFPGGLEVVFTQKTKTYIIKNQVILEKIYRKLGFLIEWHAERNKKPNQTQFQKPFQLSTNQNESNKKKKSNLSSLFFKKF